MDSIFLFNGLTENEKDEAKKLLDSTKKFKKGEIIYSAENFNNAIGYIINGKAFAVSNNGSSLHMNTFLKGSCFGVAALFGDNEQYVSSIVAKTDCEIQFISENELQKIFKLFPICSVNYIRFLSEKIRFLNKKLDMLSRPLAEDTVLNYLTTNMDQDGKAKIPKNITLVAKTLGLGRATVYRCLDSLENKGKILRENNYIKVI